MEIGKTLFKAAGYYVCVFIVVALCMWVLAQTPISREPIDFAVSLPYALGFLIPLGLAIYRKTYLAALACLVFGVSWLINGFLHYPAGNIGGEFVGYQMIPGIALYLTQTFGVFCLYLISGFCGRYSKPLLLASIISLLMTIFGALILVTATPGKLTLVLISQEHKAWRVLWNLIYLAQFVPLGIYWRGPTSTAKAEAHQESSGHQHQQAA